MSVFLRLLGRFVLGSLLVSCGIPPRAAFMRAIDGGRPDQALAAYTRFREVEGDELGMLADVARVVLRDAASRGVPEVRRAAVQQLILSGQAGRESLHALAFDSGEGVARAMALRALARRGDDHARLMLRTGLDSSDPVLVAFGVSGTDAEMDRALLLEWLTHADAAVRVAVVRRLRTIVSSDEEVRERLVQLARSDAAPQVRATVVRALATTGEGALPFLRERLGDAEAPVRLAAAAAITRLDRAVAFQALRGVFESDPSASGIEAARLLAEGNPEEAPVGLVTVRAYLMRALGATSPQRRAQAAVALTSLQDASFAGPVLERRLRSESDPQVLFALARALLRVDAEAALPSLRRLARTSDAMPQVQAAILLSLRDESEAAEVLVGVLDSEASSLLRRTAARGLAREARKPFWVRFFLVDSDPMVRVFAAGGVLSASNRAP